MCTSIHLDVNSQANTNQLTEVITARTQEETGSKALQTHTTSITVTLHLSSMCLCACACVCVCVCVDRMSCLDIKVS